MHIQLATPAVLLSMLLMPGMQAVEPPGADGMETELWVRLNQYRQDPRTGAFNITALMQRGLVGFGAHDPRIGTFDWARAAGKHVAMPALALNPSLCRAADLLLDGGASSVHEQTVDARAASAKAGYPATAETLALLSDAAPRPDVAFARALAHIHAVNVVKTRPTAQYDASRLMLKTWREAGIACRTGKNGVTVAIILGQDGGGRRIGGLVYNDADRNRTYSAGEGMPDVVIEVGGLRTTTSKAGAWWLEAADGVPLEVVYTQGSTTARRTLAGDQVVIDWRLPLAADCAQADKLLAEVDAAGADPARLRRAQVALLLGTRQTILDDARQARVETATAPVVDSYAETLRQAMAAMAGSPGEFRKHLADALKSWNGALPATWSKRLEAVCAVGQQVTAARAAKPELQPRLARAALEQLDKIHGQTEDQIVLQQLATWKATLVDLTTAAVAP